MHLRFSRNNSFRPIQLAWAALCLAAIASLAVVAPTAEAAHHHHAPSLGPPLSPTKLEQQCVDAGMKPYDIKRNVVRGVHEQHGNGWAGRITLQLGAMPSECADNGYYRVLNHRVTEQNGEHRQQWRSVVPWEGSYWNGKHTDYGIIDNDAGYGIGFGFENIGYQHNHNWIKYQYICSPGPEKTGWRFQEMDTVIHTDGAISDYGADIKGDIQIVSPRHITTHPMKVPGAC